ncbi:hypothetical protein NM208_g5547 [Fusarium decemcellulare]|uniref:Uncharacterized protein n=1 Tax=Fusarium decemcellulare TaxID=57161 RepID=A0ACC1SGT1_9HYPO|nr:hypothetical protein NM208_g5547 [Fusarium decemcellulare]
MDGVSAAASVLTIIELTVKVASLCFQYSTVVKSARSDIERLQGELISLKAVLTHVRSLIEGPNGTQLQATQELKGGLDDAASQLRRLEAKMQEPLAHSSRTRKTMSRFGLRALKWPFENSEFDAIIRNLHRNQDILSRALMIDNTALHIQTHSNIQRVSKTLDMSKLPLAKDAAFDSHKDEHDARCLPSTRVELRQKIMTWATSPDSDAVFWLNGMAGTGKSTISRTIAQSLADEGYLGASFFFKRGERDRGNASRLFTTIAAQLIARLPDIGPLVMTAIDQDPSLPYKIIREQFEKLILVPLRALDDKKAQTKTLVVVLDALDECDRADDVRLIISLLTLPKSLSSIKLRAFVTSRPELRIRLGFNSIKGNYQDLVLHEIPKPAIDHDISEFLRYRLEEIRLEYNHISDPSCQINSDWPGSEATDSLLRMATPLFIFAATICRFIQDPLFYPPRQLEKILKYQTAMHASEVEKLGKTYRPTLDQMLIGRTETAKESALNTFHAIVGAIVLLAEPLSVSTLSLLLDIPKNTINGIIGSLHSVLHVPNSASLPVRVLHLSFRDFLIGPESRQGNPFWVDGKATHERIATNCLRLLTSGNHLKQDICSLSWPGTSRHKVEQDLIDSKLPDEIRYACLYWSHHLKQSDIYITDNHEAHQFLQGHFLFWLEALSLLGQMRESSSMLNTLGSIVSPDNSNEVSSFLLDTVKFQSTFGMIIDEYPLQIYASCILFAPNNSRVKAAFTKHMPRWILQPPQTVQDWDACLRMIYTNSEYVKAIRFLPDNGGLLIASSSGKVQFWDTGTGQEKSTLQGQAGFPMCKVKRRLEQGRVESLSLSADGRRLACALEDGTILLFDTVEGKAYKRLCEHGLGIKSLALSPNGELLAFASADETVRLWDVESSREVQKLETSASSLSFSPNGTQFQISDRSGIELYDTRSGSQLHRLKSRSGLTKTTTFSHDGRVLASVDLSGSIVLWDATEGKEIQNLEHHYGWFVTLDFSPDGLLLASTSNEGTIRLWELNPVSETNSTETSCAGLLSLSRDGKRVISSGFHDSLIEIWDLDVGQKTMTLYDGENERGACFSVEDDTIITASQPSTVRFHDSISVEETLVFTAKADEGLEGKFLSPNGKTLVLADGTSVEIWDVPSGERRHRLKQDSTEEEWLREASVSADNKAFAAAFEPFAGGSSPCAVVLWDLETRNKMWTVHLERIPGISAMAFSPDGSILAIGGDSHTITFLDVAGGTHLATFQIDATLAHMSFELGGCRLSTDKGELAVPLDILRQGTDKSESYLPFEGYGFSRNGEWITWKSRELLWLPRGYHHHTSLVKGPTVVLGVTAGRVLVFKFAETPSFHSD